MYVRIRRPILVRDGARKHHLLYPGDHWRRWKLGNPWAHDFLVGDDGVAYEKPGPRQYSQGSPLISVVADAWQLELVSRAWLETEVDRRIEEAKRLSGMPWSVDENCQDYLSLITTGETGSFQRDGLLGVGLILGGLYCASSLFGDRRSG